MIAIVTTSSVSCFNKCFFKKMLIEIKFSYLISDTLVDLSLLYLELETVY